MNSSQPRFERRPPERTGPIRNPLTGDRRRTAPGATANGGAGNGTTASAATANGAGANGTLRGALECGVQTAYAVIDEYLRRGQDAARLNQIHPQSKGDMNNDKSSYGNWSNPWSAANPLMDQWSAAIRAWADVWSNFIPGGFPGARPGAPSGGWPGGWPGAWSGAWGPQAAAGPAAGYPSAPPPALSVEVSSARPTEVTVLLKPGACLTGLVADSFAPPLHHCVWLQPKGGRLHIRVTVADSQAAGRYNGVVRNADGSVAGELTVTIADPSNSPT